MNKKEFIKRKTRHKKYIDHEVCKTCLEPCCSKCGCDALPLDIEPFTSDHIIELIDKGIYSITYTFWYGGEVFPILRTREVGAGVFNFSDEDKPCALLGDNGCTLSDEERPTMALLLIPIKHLFVDEWRSCKQLINTKQFLNLWIEKVDIMEQVVKHYSQGKDFKTLYTEYLNGER